jgi:GH24 family phage-related lysozyme (muramidase)
MNMRDFWANEAAAMRDTSGVLGKEVLKPVTSTEKRSSEGKFYWDKSDTNQIQSYKVNVAGDLIGMTVPANQRNPVSKFSNNPGEEGFTVQVNSSYFTWSGKPKSSTSFEKGSFRILGTDNSYWSAIILNSNGTKNIHQVFHIDTLNISQNGLKFLASEEDYYPKWIDTNKTMNDHSYTIGFGHAIPNSGTEPTIYANGIELKDAAALLINDVNADIAIFKTQVRQRGFLLMTQYEFDCLVSIFYNRGEGAFARSNMLKNVMSLNLTSEQIKQEISTAYTNASAGLPIRRAREANMFLFNEYEFKDKRYLSAF